MSRSIRIPLVSVFLVSIACASLAIVPTPEGAVAPNFDLRDGLLRPESLQRTDLDQHLSSRLGVQVKTTVDSLRGTLRTLRGAQRGIFLSPPSTDFRSVLAKRFVLDHLEVFGFTPAEVDALVIDTDYLTQHSGMHHIWMQQMVAGVPVHGGRIGVNFTAAGQIINVNVGPIVPGLRAETLPAMPAEQAIRFAAGYIDQPFPRGAAGPVFANAIDDRTLLFEKAHFQAPIRSETIYVPMPDGARLAYRIVLDSNEYPAMYEVFVDAATGELLIRFNLTQYFWTATGYEISPAVTPVRKVWDLSVPVPPTPESPFGWYDIVSFLTVSNNVHSHEDPSVMPACTANGPFNEVPDQFSWDFDFPIDLTQAPSTYVNAAITNLFVINNMIHNRLYRYGFDEPSGNFQFNNNGKLAVGDGDRDRVDAQAQDRRDCGQANNANFSTPVDGQPGRMQMYIWDAPTPDRDGDLDAEIIIHELCHGLSNRLVGGRTCVGNCALGPGQPGAMGESWGDMMASSYSNDDALAEYSVGNADGLRTMRFGSSTYTISNTGMGGCQVHLNGEIWSRALWAIRDQFIMAYGLDPGREKHERYIVDSLKLVVTNPGFLDARDAMITAAINRRDECLMWNGFVTAGMGPAAVLSTNCPPTSISEDPNIPAYCICSPGAPNVTPNSFKGAPSGGGRFTWTWQSTGTGEWNFHYTTTKSEIPNLYMLPLSLIRPTVTSPMIDVGDAPAGFYQIYGADGCTGESQP